MMRGFLSWHLVLISARIILTNAGSYLIMHCFTEVPMTKEIITAGLPSSSNPLSPAVRWGNLLFTSGQVGRDHSTGKLVTGITDQTRQTLENLQAVLKAGGSSLDKVLKVTVFIVDINLKEAMNAVYKEYFPTAPPSRTCVEVSALSPGVFVEIEAMAGI
jgi:2-iminobutanoate/2-iminopropanoate deaminase